MRSPLDMTRTTWPTEAVILARPRRVAAVRRAGVSSVLSMMFLVIFGSLAAAMAVVAQGNLRTADSSLRVSRAMSAAETGLVFAKRRLARESRRFVVEKGVIDADFADDLWSGNLTATDLTVLPPNGYTETTPAGGIAEAIRNAHAFDDHSIVVEAGDSSLPDIDGFGTVRTRPIAMSAAPEAPYFRLQYDMLATEPMVRVTAEGVDGPITRVLQMDFRIDKKIEYAILSPNRIMIGKNVMVEGPLGSRFGIVAGELDTEHGDPLVLRSDFYFLDAALDAKLDTYFTQLIGNDIDGDGRMRPEHPAEAAGLSGHPELADHDGDEYVDDFDLFLGHFDANADGRIVYDSDRTVAAGLGALAEEFSGVDDQLARLIDLADPDRDDDGIPGTASDVGLGFGDGVINILDLYAKVTGRLAFAASRTDWETAHGASYQTIVQGPIRHDQDVAPVDFEVSDEDLLEITTPMFDGSQGWFEANGTGDFAAQVAASPGTYTPPGPTTWEPVPFGSEGAYDHYQRPVYEDMTFTNVLIPQGLNALFVDCTFVGVTYIEATADCDHENWNYAGAYQAVTDPDTGDVTYELKFPDLTADLAGTPIADTRPYSNNIRFHNCTFLGSLAGDRIDEYTHWRNKIQMTGNTRFYLDPTDAELLAQPDAAALASALGGVSVADREELAKSSILMPGWSVDVGNFDNEQGADPSDTPAVLLRGTIIAGILDVRGTADVFGTLLMTFRPTSGAGPLFYGGQVDAFNTTIGYFGPIDGDNEGIDPSDPGFNGFGEIRLRYNPDAQLPDGIPWPIRIDAESDTYTEGGLG